MLELLRDPQALRADVTVYRGRREYRRVRLGLIENGIDRSLEALRLMAEED